jgi:hypothetical protein
MKGSLFLAAGILLALGIFFARDRLKRAFQIGGILYAVVLVGRLLVYGFQDGDNFLDILIVGGAFLLVWVVAWAGTRAALKYRERPGQRHE